MSKHAELIRAYGFFGSYCWYCGRELDGQSIMEHQTPRSRGGTDANNLVVACRSCNSTKSFCTVEEYRELLAERCSVSTQDVIFFGEIPDYQAAERRARLTIEAHGTIPFDSSPFQISDSVLQLTVISCS